MKSLFTSVFDLGRSMFNVVPIFLLLVLTNSDAPAIVDTNDNGLSDFWERTFNHEQLFPPSFDSQADPDGDGWTHAQEAVAGTDPFSATPPAGFVRPEFVHIPAVYGPPEEAGGEPWLITPEAISITWPTLEGKHYTLLAAVSLDVGAWAPIGAPSAGTGLEMDAVVTLTQPDGSTPASQFFRVAIEDIDTDADGVTDLEERDLGSSPFFADSNNDGIGDAEAAAAGSNPSAATPDGNGDGLPDNELYAVVFEFLYETLEKYPPGFLALSGIDNTNKYLTSTLSDLYSVTNSPRYTTVNNGAQIETSNYLDADGTTLRDNPREQSSGISYNDWEVANRVPLGTGESLEWEQFQNSTSIPPATALLRTTTLTRKQKWKLKKNGALLRSGEETIVKTTETRLSKLMTLPEYWTSHFKTLPWVSAAAWTRRGPSESGSSPLSASGALTIRQEYLRNYSPLGMWISTPARMNTNGTCSDHRFKTARWRRVKFNPSDPGRHHYTAPPAAYSRKYYFRVDQKDQILPAPATSLLKGIVEIECEGNQGGGDWQEVPESKFSPFRLEDPVGLASFNYLTRGYSYVTLEGLSTDIATDANRDGEITYDGKDLTSAEKPFRFWVNSDRDNVEADEPIIVEPNDRDWIDDTIATKRDLEDFCRLKLSIGIPRSELIAGDFKIGLKFVDATGTGPKIKVWPNQSVSGNLDYLTDHNAAQAQISKTPFSNDGGVILIPPAYWNDAETSTAHLIFEGESEGLAKLVVVIQNASGTELGQSAGTWLHLLDVRKMYQRARVVNEPGQIPDPWVNANPPAQTWVWDPNGNDPVEDPNAEPVTAVFVHGWRLKYNDFMNWSDTSYKRLWHQGFKGEFYSFRWATFSGDNNGLPYGLDEQLEAQSGDDSIVIPPGGLTYNASEYRAWLCGPTLASFVNQLPNPGKRSLFAHSMGNVISGAALRSGMLVDNYAMCNSAMAAMAYDPNQTLRTGDIFPPFTPAVNQKTPDTDPNLSIRTGFGLENKFNLDSMPEVFSFVLSDDSALSNWRLNNRLFKPYLNYLYTENSILQPFPLVHQPFPLSPFRPVTGLNEAMGYVTKSRTMAAGAELRTAGSIDDTQDMSGWFGTTHSAQWRWSNHSVHMFWTKLVEELNLNRN